MIRDKNEFARFFESDILPKYGYQVNEIKKTREQVLDFVKKLIICLLLMAILPFGFVIGIPLLFLYLRKIFKKNNITFTRDATNSSSNSFKEHIFNDILDRVFPNLRYSDNETLTEEDFISYSIISPSFVDSYRAEDAFVGTIGGRKIRISESTIYKKQDRDSYTRLFFGLIVETELDVGSNFKMIVTKKNFFSRGTQRINLGGELTLEEIGISNLHLDDNNRIFTNDSIRTNKILQPRNVDKLVRFFENKNIDICFAITNNKLVMLLENRQNLFEIFNEGKFESEVIWDELMTIFDAIKLSIDFIDQLEISEKK